MHVDTFRAGTPPRPREGGARPLLARVRLREERLLSRWGVLGVVLVLILASLWLRVAALRFHFWIDEGLSAGIASHPLSAIPSVLREDGSPPLYYLLLHVWMALRGRGEVATHELSLIFALLTIPIAYWAGASLFDRRSGLVCAVLAAGTPFLTAYGQETRMYALLALIALVASASLVHAFALRHRRYLPVFAASLTAALYTHNWALFFGLMAAVAFLLCVRAAPRDQRRSLWRDGALAFGGVAVLYAPWVPTLLYQAAHTGAPWSDRPVVWSLTQGSYALVGGRGAAVALLLGAGSGLLTLRDERSAGRTVRLALTCLLLLSVGTLITAWLYSRISPAWAVRYLAVIVGPMILLFGLGVARAGRLGLVVLAIAGSFWLVDPRPHSLDTKSNVALALAKVRPMLGAGTLVLSSQPEQVPTLAYYLPGVSRFGTPLGAVADPRVVDWRDALRRLRRSSVRSTLVPMIRALAPGERLVLVVPLNAPTHPAWLELIRRYSTQWAAFLAHDSSLKQLAATSAHSNLAGIPVGVTLFLRRGGKARSGARR